MYGSSIAVSTARIGMPAALALAMVSFQTRLSTEPMMMADGFWVMTLSTAAFWAPASWVSVVRSMNLTPLALASSAAALPSVFQKSLLVAKPV